MDYIISILDNSQDSETIALEIMNSDETSNALFTIFDYAIQSCNRKAQMDSLDNALGSFIRNLWDIAYNYGWEDAKSED